jgi:hypothetical protein
MEIAIKSNFGYKWGNFQRPSEGNQLFGMLYYDCLTLIFFDPDTELRLVMNKMKEELFEIKISKA